jgi:hypothetical protein
VSSTPDHRDPPAVPAQPPQAKPRRLWVAIAPAPRALVPRDHIFVVPRGGPLPVHRSACVQGAEPAGPWIVRAGVRLPAGELGGPGQPHGTRWLGALHARWLGYMGLPGVAVYQGRTVRHWASFLARAPGDVVLGERKITSVAEHRCGDAALVVGATLLLVPPWSLFCRAVGAPQRDVPALQEASLAAATLLPMLDPEAWAAHLRRMLHLSLALGELLDPGFGAG